MRDNYLTVVRFCGEPEHREALVKLGHELNTIIPDSFDDFDFKHPNRFSTTIAEDYEWERHKAAIVAFLDSCKDVVARARRIGIRIQFDVAVWAQSFRGGVVYRCMLFEQEFMAKLASMDVSIVVSVYGGSRSGR